MPLCFLFDENFAGEVWQAAHRHNARNADWLDVVRVGDVPELPKGTPDPDILLWCEANGRILVSYDKSSLPVHLADHLAAGHHLPGIFLFQRKTSFATIVAMLALAAQASEEGEWDDRVEYLD